MEQNQKNDKAKETKAAETVLTLENHDVNMKFEFNSEMLLNRMVSTEPMSEKVPRFNFSAFGSNAIAVALSSYFYRHELENVYDNIQNHEPKHNPDFYVDYNTAMLTLSGTAAMMFYAAFNLTLENIAGLSELLHMPALKRLSYDNLLIHVIIEMLMCAGLTKPADGSKIDAERIRSEVVRLASEMKLGDPEYAPPFDELDLPTI